METFDENAIVVRGGIQPAMSIEDALARYRALAEFIKAVMRPGHDYGVIPGTNKPTLYKPGAEKFCTLFKFTPEFELVNSILDFEKGFFYFQYQCRVTRDGQLVATGLGSCNNRERKYRLRYVPVGNASEMEKSLALRTETKKGKYGPYQVYVLENNEPCDLVNTIDKMAQKRALIAAILIAANVSDYFTQDLEDAGEVVDGEVVEAEPRKSVRREPRREKAPAPAAAPANQVQVESSDLDQEPSKTAWTEWYTLVAKAKVLNIPIPEADEASMTLGRLRQLYAELSAGVKAAKAAAGE